MAEKPVIRNMPCAIVFQGEIGGNKWKFVVFG
jgi:hypothetical protein